MKILQKKKIKNKKKYVYKKQAKYVILKFYVSNNEYKNNFKLTDDRI